MGTFDGVAKINTETRKIDFYDELNFQGSHLGASVYVNGDEVWATISANAYNDGAAAYYNSEDNTWTNFGPKDFKKNDWNRVDFHRFIVSSEGVFASYQDGGPENTVLAKFNPVDQKWESVYSAGHEEFERSIDSYLPAEESYKGYRIDYTSQDPAAKINVYRDGEWKERGVFPSYSALSPLIGDTYYLLSLAGIDSFSKDDAFPQNIVADELPANSVDHAQFFISEDRVNLIVLSSDVMKMGGIVLGYSVQVLNTKDLSYYSLEIDGDELEGDDIFDVSEKTEMMQDGEKLYWPLTSGKKLTLDLDEKTFAVN